MFLGVFAILSKAAVVFPLDHNSMDFLTIVCQSEAFFPRKSSGRNWIT